MTSENTTTDMTEENTKKSRVKSRFWLIAVVGVFSIAIVVGAGIYWEKHLEQWVKVDLPHEGQETSEVSSLVPYVCDKDPEACEGRPLTFRGRDAEEKIPEVLVDIEKDEILLVPSIKHPERTPEAEAKDQGGVSKSILETLENLPIIQDLESKLGLIETISPMQERVEILSMLALLEAVCVGRISSETLAKGLQNCATSELQLLATMVPQGRLIPFDRLPIYTTQTPDPAPKSVLEKVVAWGESFVEVKSDEEILAEQKVHDFKVACQLGNFDRAFALYQDFNDDQRYAYGDWIQEIKKRKQLQVISDKLLSLLAEVS